MFFFINNTNNKCLLAVHRTSIGRVCWNSIGLPLAMSVRIPSVLVISVAGLLSVHWQSVGKVRWTARSAQKCSDQLRRIIGKILWWKSKKIWILLTLSLSESAQKSSGSVKTSRLLRLLKTQGYIFQYQRPWTLALRLWWCVCSVCEWVLGVLGFFLRHLILVSRVSHFLIHPHAMRISEHPGELFLHWTSTMQIKIT